MRRKRRSEVEPETPEAEAVGCVCKVWPGTGQRWNTGNCKYHAGIFGGFAHRDVPTPRRDRLERTCSPERFAAIEALAEQFPENWSPRKDEAAWEERRWRWAEFAVDRAYPGREPAPLR